MGRQSSGVTLLRWATGSKFVKGLQVQMPKGRIVCRVHSWTEGMSPPKIFKSKMLKFYFQDFGARFYNILMVKMGRGWGLSDPLGLSPQQLRPCKETEKVKSVYESSKSNILLHSVMFLIKMCHNFSSMGNIENIQTQKYINRNNLCGL